jgi:metal-responsive CopG/Arc/MetJ family transcriptional regulator
MSMPPDDLKLEIMTVRVPYGTLARIDRVLRGGELRSAFIRSAVEAELQSRKPPRKARRDRTSELSAA